MFWHSPQNLPHQASKQAGHTDPKSIVAIVQEFTGRQQGPGAGRGQTCFWQHRVECLFKHCCCSLQSISPADMPGFLFPSSGTNCHLPCTTRCSAHWCGLSDACAACRGGSSSGRGEPSLSARCRAAGFSGGDPSPWHGNRGGGEAREPAGCSE